MPKSIRLNTTHYFIIIIPNIRELQQIPSIHFSHVKFTDFGKPHKNYTKEPFSYLVNNTSLPSNNSLRFKKILLQNDF